MPFGRFRRRLLSTFRAVYGGVQHERMKLPAYSGNLFNPDRFMFLEGRKPGTSWRNTPANPLPVNNRTVLHLLEALQFLQVKVQGGGPTERRRLSFRALDIEQIGHVYEGLIARDRDLKIIPGLAESWETPEPTRWRFHLRKNVKFQNGDPFTADDVLFSADRVRANGSNLATRIDADVIWVALNELGKANLLTETVTTAPRISRRVLMRCLGRLVTRPRCPSRPCRGAHSPKGAPDAQIACPGSPCTLIEACVRRPCAGPADST